MMNFDSNIFLILIAMLLGGSWGCGGSAPATKTAAAETAKTTVAQLSERTQRLWSEAKDEFEKHEKSGWNSGSCSDVADKFMACTAEKSDFAEAYFMAGLVKARCNQKEDAYALYEKALEVNPKFCKARVGLAVKQLEEGNSTEAFAEFQRAVADDAQCMEGYVNLATMQRQRARTKQQFDEALNNLRRALAIDANFLPAFNQMGLLYLARARLDPKSLDLAEIVCRQAQQINGDYAPIYNTWGLVNMQQDKIIEAAAKFKRAFELDSSLFEAYMNFAQITISYRGYQEAKDAFAKAVELKPGSYEAHVGLGAAHRGLRNFNDAETHYQKAKELEGSRPEVYFNLGILYQDYKGGSIPDLEKAKDYYEDFLRRAGSGSEFAEKVAEVRRRCKDESGKRRRRRQDCRPGRLQNIELAISGLRQAEAMQ